eukprot:15482590-Alexandrium_andersonii.AAC.1
MLLEATDTQAALRLGGFGNQALEVSLERGDVHRDQSDVITTLYAVLWPRIEGLPNALARPGGEKTDDADGRESSTGHRQDERQPYKRSAGHSRPGKSLLQALTA